MYTVIEKSLYKVRERGGFRYLDEGPVTECPPVVFLHGMLGNLTNWTDAVQSVVANGYRAIVPFLPVYTLPVAKTSMQGLVQYVHGFLNAMELDCMTLAGNSLGGQLATLYILDHPQRACALILTGSSGLYEVEMGRGNPRRYDPNFIRDRAAITFYKKEHVTEDLVNEMLEVVADRACAIRLIKIARASKNETVRTRLHEIQVPTLLVWGANDAITPPDVAREFEELIPDTELHLIDKCGHAPMLEHPETFNQIMLNFLRERVSAATLTV